MSLFVTVHFHDVDVGLFNNHVTRGSIIFIDFICHNAIKGFKINWPLCKLQCYIRIIWCSESDAEPRIYETEH